MYVERGYAGHILTRCFYHHQQLPINRLNLIIRYQIIILCTYSLIKDIIRQRQSYFVKWNNMYDDELHYKWNYVM